MFENITLHRKLKIDETAELLFWKYEDIDIKYNNNICYIVQTTGTTGNNKLVKVEHSCISSNIFSLLEIFQLSNEIIYYGTPLTFDPSMIELFLALASGSCLLIVPDNIKRVPNLLLKAMFPLKNNYCNGVTFLQMVPSVFNQWQSDNIRFIFEKSSLKHLVLGGEKFPIDILNYISNNVNVYNIYGITEVSCWASIYKVEANMSSVCIGSPLNDTILEIRNDNNVTISNGIGELFIGKETHIIF